MPERDVLMLMAESRANAEIAADLSLSKAGVSKHEASVFLRLCFEHGEDTHRVKVILAWSEWR